MRNGAYSPHHLHRDGYSRLRGLSRAPQNALVGRVDEVLRNQNAVLQDASIQPNAAFAYRFGNKFGREISRNAISVQASGVDIEHSHSNPPVRVEGQPTTSVRFPTQPCRDLVTKCFLSHPGQVWDLTLLRLKRSHTKVVQPYQSQLAARGSTSFAGRVGVVSWNHQACGDRRCQGERFEQLFEEISAENVFLNSGAFAASFGQTKSPMSSSRSGRAARNARRNSTSRGTASLPMKHSWSCSTNLGRASGLDRSAA